jgi:ATP-dependent protease ClpP protease subunit
MITTETRARTHKTAKPAFFVSKPARTIEWLGGVTYDNLNSTLSSIKALLKEDMQGEIQLVINSYGGISAIGMTFFDMMKSVLKPNLTTIGSGDVDSSGIVVFLAGSRRYLTKNTTLLLHLAGRTLPARRRVSTADMEEMLKEDRLKDYQYACIVAEACRDKYTPEMILDLMRANTILTAEEAVNMGLADRVLS